MKIHRFLFSFGANANSLEIREGDTFNQIKNVLKLKPREKVLFLDGRGLEAQAKLVSYEKGKILFDIIEIKKAKIAPVEIILYCAVLKKDNFEIMAQKAAELGVSKIVPIITKRTVKLDLNIGRIRKIMEEAIELSGRNYVPEIFSPIKFEDALRDAKKNSINIFCDKSGKPIDISALKTAQSMGVFIGPEGGWDEREIVSAQKSGCRTARLSDFILRAETAAIAAVCVISYFML